VRSNSHAEAAPRGAHCHSEAAFVAFHDWRMAASLVGRRNHSAQTGLAGKIHDGTDLIRPRTVVFNLPSVSAVQTIAPQCDLRQTRNWQSPCAGDITDLHVSRTRLRERVLPAANTPADSSGRSQSCNNSRLLTGRPVHLKHVVATDPQPVGCIIGAGRRSLESGAGSCAHRLSMRRRNESDTAKVVVKTTEGHLHPAGGA